MHGRECIEINLIPIGDGNDTDKKHPCFMSIEINLIPIGDGNEYLYIVQSADSAIEINLIPIGDGNSRER